MSSNIQPRYVTMYVTMCVLLSHKVCHRAFYYVCSTKSLCNYVIWCFMLCLHILVCFFEDMFDRIEHRLCLRHLYVNFKKKFDGSTLIRDFIMGAAKATYYQAW